MKCAINAHSDTRSRRNQYSRILKKNSIVTAGVNEILLHNPRAKCYKRVSLGDSFAVKFYRFLSSTVKKAVIIRHQTVSMSVKYHYFSAAHPGLLAFQRIVSTVKAVSMFPNTLTL